MGGGVSLIPGGEIEEKGGAWGVIVRSALEKRM